MRPIKADGLRYHAAAPLISALRDRGLIKAIAYPSDEKTTFEAARTFLQCEGWLIAPESSHAVRATIDEALKNEKTGEEKVICRLSTQAT